MQIIRPGYDNPSEPPRWLIWAGLVIFILAVMIGGWLDTPPSEITTTTSCL